MEGVGAFQSGPRLRFEGGAHQESLQGPGARGRRGTQGSCRVCAGAVGERSGARADRARRKGGGGEGLRRSRGRAELLEGPPPFPTPGPALAPSPGSLGTPPSAPVRPHPVLVPSPSSVRRLLHIPRTGSLLLPPPPPPPPLLPCSLRLLPSLCVQSSPLGPSRQPLAPGCSVFPLALPPPAVYRLSLPTSLAPDPAGDPRSIGPTPPAAMLLWASAPGAGAAWPLPCPSGGLCSQGSASLLTLADWECSEPLRLYSFWLWPWSPGFPGWGL